MNRVFAVLLTLVFPTLATVVWIVGDSAGWIIPTPLYLVGSYLLVLTAAWVTWQGLRLGEFQTTAADVAELRRVREQFTTLYENSPVPYITLDARGAIALYNLAAVQLFDTDPQELIGHRLEDHLTSPDEDKLGVLLGKLRQQSSIIGEEVQIDTVGGSRRWVLLSVFSHDRSRQRLAALVDITEQKRIDTAKSEFVALATHQLRTPIAAIRWNLELMERKLRKTESTEHEKYLEKITRNVERMTALISDFLSVSKLETGTFAANEEEIELASYLDEIADEFAPEIEKKQIELHTETEPTEQRITADSRLFHIVTSNLLSNAVKYTPEGGRIDWGYQLRDDELLFRVADSGIGIPAEEQANLFQKFFRATNAQQHKAEGTGLGLYIVQQSVEQLGGTISVESVENEGTTFTVRLPL